MRDTIEIRGTVVSVSEMSVKIRTEAHSDGEAPIVPDSDGCVSVYFPDPLKERETGHLQREFGSVIGVAGAARIVVDVAPPRRKRARK